MILQKFHPVTGTLLIESTSPETGHMAHYSSTCHVLTERVGRTW